MVLSILTIQYIVSPSAFGKSFNLLEIVLTNLSLVFFSVIHFSNALLQKTKYIYLNSGILFYLVGSTLIFCAGNFYSEGTGNTQYIIWLYNAVLFIIYLVFIFLEWYKNYRKT
jgi:tetraacyldisaccharide-1-P 4'-kinase